MQEVSMDNTTNEPAYDCVLVFAEWWIVPVSGVGIVVALAFIAWGLGL